MTIPDSASTGEAAAVTAPTDPPRITPEGVAALRRKIGIDWPYTRWSTWNEEASRDGIRHYAFGFGDDNPLWWDPEHAAQSRWGAIIAPPLYLECAGISPRVVLTEEQRQARSSGGLPGLSMFWAGDRIQFFSPVREGDRIYVRRFYVDVQEKPSSGTFGATVMSVRRRVFTNQAHDLVAIWDADFVHAEPKPPGTVDGKRRGEQHIYTDEELAAIDAAYAAETIRGAEPRYVETVREGDELPGLIKGPLTVSDMIAWLQGAGRHELYPYRLQYRNRRRAPDFLYPRNSFGAYEPMLRGHYDSAFARSLGLSGPYDFGAMRSAWMVQLVTDWMGDDAIIVQVRDRMIHFTGVGDVVSIGGSVSGVSEADGWPEVECALTCSNRLGEVIATATIQVRLPSRSRGLPEYPAPPDDGGLLPGVPAVAV
jgi:acyl dehydratase